MLLSTSQRGWTRWMRRYFRQQPRTEVTSRGKLRNQIGTALGVTRDEVDVSVANLGKLQLVGLAHPPDGTIAPFWARVSARRQVNDRSGRNVAVPHAGIGLGRCRGRSVISEIMALSNPAAQSTLRSSDLVAIILTAASFISPHRPRSVPQTLHRAIESSVGLSGSSTPLASRHVGHSVAATASKISILQNPLVGRLRTGRATDRPPRAGPPIADRR